MRVAVTGANGKVGQMVVMELLRHSAIATVQAIEACYNGVLLKQDLSCHTPVIDCSKAKRFYGWEAQYTWRQAPEA
jgi:nucleoside-diphosphate-sugar epimerase